MNFLPLTHLSNKAQIGVDEPAPFKLLHPATWEEAQQMLRSFGDEAVLLAGGCDILEKIKTQWIKPRYVVNLKSVQDLIEPKQRLIQSLTTLSEIERSQN